MTTITHRTIEEVDDALGIMWFEADQQGDGSLRAEIERVAQPFYRPLAPSGMIRETVERAHDLFERVRDEYLERAGPSVSGELVACPHCREEE